MSSNRPLPGDLKVTGMDQASIYAWMANVTDLLNEIQTDHATNKATIDALVTLTTELRTDHATFITAVANIGTTVANFKTIYDAHTHTADGNASRTSLPDTGTPTGSPSAASAFTNTVGSAPATITAAAASAGPATLANSTAITLSRS